MTSRVVFLDWEKRQKGINRAVVGVRFAPGKTGYFYLNEWLKMSTGFILADNFEKTSAVVRSFRKRKELSAYELKDRFHDGERYQTFHVEVPYDRALIERLPGFFQKGEYARTLRYQNPWFYKEFVPDARLYKAFEIKGGVDKKLAELKSVLGSRMFNKTMRAAASGQEISVASSGSELIGQVFESIREADLLLKQINRKNSFLYNLNSSDTEIYLDSKQGFRVLDDVITVDEIRADRWVFFDIEKPLWKSDWQKAMISARNSLAKQDVHVSRKERRLKCLEAALDNASNDEKRQKIYKKIEANKRAVANYYSVSVEEREERRQRFVSKLEGRLTEKIAGREVHWWDDKYDAKISWFHIVFRMEDGTEIKEIHTLYSFGQDCVEGFKVVSHSSEKELLNSVLGLIKRIKPFVYANHNPAYDVSQVKRAAEETGSEGFDVLVKSVFAGRDVSISAYQRIKENQGEINIDTWRRSANDEPYLSSGNPKGNHKLASVSSFWFGESTFKKSIDYDMMREFEVKAINGDVSAMRALAKYAVSDVLIVKKILEETPYLERAYDTWKMMPFTTLTKAAFSSAQVKEITEYEHWKRHGNHLNFGWFGDKRRKEREIVREKRLPEIKKKQLQDEEINVYPIRGFYPEVVQKYMPLELWILDLITKNYPMFREYAFGLRSKPLDRIAQLQPLKHFFANEMAVDAYYGLNAKFRYDDRVGASWKDPGSLSMLLSAFNNNVKKRDKSSEDSLRRFDSLVDLSRDLYRGVYSNLPSDLRNAIRLPRFKIGCEQAEMDFEDWVVRDNYDILKALTNKIGVRNHLNDKGKRTFDNLVTRFGNLGRHLDMLKGCAEVVLADFASKSEASAFSYVLPGFDLSFFDVKREKARFDISPGNLVYLEFLRRRALTRAKRFYAKYGFPLEASDGTGFRDKIRQAYKSLGNELRARGTQVIEQRGDYLFLLGGDLKFDNKSCLIPVRKIWNFSVDPGNPRLMKRSRKNAETPLDTGLALFGTYNPEPESFFFKDWSC